MEKKRSIKTRLLAAGLALLLLGLGTPMAGGSYVGAMADGAVSSESEKFETGKTVDDKPQILSIQESLENDNINLDEEYLIYLQQNGIEVIDGNISVKTLEQFIAIRDYYLKYYEETGAFDDTHHSYVSDEQLKKAYFSLNMYSINYDNLSKELKENLLSGGVVVLDSFKEICENFPYNRSLVNERRILDGPNGKSIVSLVNLIFNNEIRKVEAMFEKDLSALQALDAVSNREVVIQYGDKYLQYLYDEGTYYQPNFMKLPSTCQMPIIMNIDSVKNLLMGSKYRDFGFINMRLSEILDLYYTVYDQIREESLALLN